MGAALGDGERLENAITAGVLRDSRGYHVDRWATNRRSRYHALAPNLSSPILCRLILNQIR